MCQASVALWHAGYPDQSAAIAAKALALAEQLKHVSTEGYCRFFVGLLCSFNRRNYQLLEGHARKLLEFSELHDIPQWIAYASCFIAPCLTVSGRAEEALEQLEKGLALCNRLDNLVYRPTLLGFAAEAKIACGQLDEADNVIAEALATAERTKERWMVAGLWSTRGKIATARGDMDEAIQTYGRAIQVAREQGSKMFELRAATELARVWCKRGRAGNARELLAPIYREFIEGLGETDLIEAASILRQVEAN
jgi:predicted ATPase